MIQSKIPVIVYDRNQIEDIVKIEVRPSTEKVEGGQKFLVIDWALNNTKDALFSKEIFWTTEQINQMNDYLEANYDFSGLSRVDAEYKKLQLALLIDTQTNLLPNGKTIRGLMPEDWELTPIV